MILIHLFNFFAVIDCYYSCLQALSDQQVQDFLKNGSIELRGYKLNREDIRVIFSFTGPAASQLAQQYEAHSDNDVS